VGHKDEVHVPDLTGKDLDAAEKLLAQNSLILGETRQRHDPKPAGLIVGQHPPAGSAVKGGRSVAVVVSLGEEGGVVPKLSGETLRNARLSLESAGLTLGEEVQVNSETADKDAIIASEPAENAHAPRGAAVSVLVSRGWPSQAYIMPDLKGLDSIEMERRLTEAGFLVEVEMTGVRSRGRRGIVNHEPAPGARIQVGERITLFSE
jgi:serine/threonine-protein kinase